VYMDRDNLLTNAEYETGQSEGNLKWVETSYFSDENDFRDLYGDPQAFYKVFGATIIDLDDIVIRTGHEINYKDGQGNVVPSDDMGKLTIIASMLPRYL
jgi:hypothetical protein